MLNYSIGTGKSEEELFVESEIGHFVMQHLSIENLKEATRLYMSDFVKISHKASCSREEMVTGYAFLMYNYFKMNIGCCKLFILDWLFLLFIGSLRVSPCLF